MHGDDIKDFLSKVDHYLTEKHKSNLKADPDAQIFPLRIIGKSALILSGLKDSPGTSDIDSLCLEAKNTNDTSASLVQDLATKFGRSNLKIYSYYLDFVKESMVMLPQSIQWNSLKSDYKSLDVQYLRPEYVTASKLFSAFTTPPRKRDKQDIIAVLDQELIQFQTLLNLADMMFDFYEMDARSDRFEKVYKYITEELIPTYGPANLTYVPGL